MTPFNKMPVLKTHLGKGGRIVIPASYRKQLGLQTGDELLLRIEDGGLHVQTLTQAIQRAQAIVGVYALQRQLSQELIEERRQTAQDE